MKYQLINPTQNPSSSTPKATSTQTSSGRGFQSKFKWSNQETNQSNSRFYSNGTQPIKYEMAALKGLLNRRQRKIIYKGKEDFVYKKLSELGIRGSIPLHVEKRMVRKFSMIC